MFVHPQIPDLQILSKPYINVDMINSRNPCPSVIWFCCPCRSGARGGRSSDEEPMQTDGYAPGPKDNPLYTAEPLTLEDLTLLCELFYLPYEHGATAVRMLQELHWLRRHRDSGDHPEQVSSQTLFFF